MKAIIVKIIYNDMEAFLVHNSWIMRIQFHRIIGIALSNIEWCSFVMKMLFLFYLFISIFKNFFLKNSFYYASWTVMRFSHVCHALTLLPCCHALLHVCLSVHPPQVNGTFPPKVKNDAHAVILDFIRSRPPLRSVSILLLVFPHLVWVEG